MPHRIEVDDEILAYLKDQAEAFVDTPNSVLRRLLLADGSNECPSDSPPNKLSQGLIPGVPRDTPKALEQILQVVHLTLKSSRTRAEATHTVARHHDIAFQTVLDKYSRQLDLRTDDFDALLSEPDLGRLRELLAAKFDRHQDVIKTILTECTTV